MGGGSHVPILFSAVESWFQTEGGGRVKVQRTMNAAESVAKGCALIAAAHSAAFRMRPFNVVDSHTRPYRFRLKKPPTSSMASLAVEVPPGTALPYRRCDVVPLDKMVECVEVDVEEGKELVAKYTLRMTAADDNGYTKSYKKESKAKVGRSPRLEGIE